MSVSTNVHRITKFVVEDLYPERPGSTITIDFITEEGRACVFLNDKTLAELETEISAYKLRRAPVAEAA